MPQRTLASASAESADADVPANEPVSIDTFRLNLARRMMDATKAWRECRRGACRRARRCMDRRVRCIGDMCPPRTPHETAQITADMQRALQRRLAELARGAAE